MPVLRELSSLPGVFSILGCGGNGITFSMLAAHLAKAWLAGRRDPDWTLDCPAAAHGVQTREF